MITVKATFADGDYIISGFNGTFEAAMRYYLGSKFNLGIAEDNMQECTGLELIKELSALEEAKLHINEFCMEHWNSLGDFSDLTAVPIGYTDSPDCDIPIQLYADLEGCRFIRYLGDVCIEDTRYPSLADMNGALLEYFDPTAHYGVTEEDILRFEERNPVSKGVEA